MNDSIWTKDATLPSFPQMEGDLKTDVLIIGGGLAGILCAWKLRQEGVDCTLIEADRICRGVSRNTTAKITSQHGLIYDRLVCKFGTERAALYYSANEEAREEYGMLFRDIRCDSESKDSYLYAVHSTEKLEKELEALGKIGVTADFTDRLKLPFPVAGAVRFRNQAQFHPLKLVSGIVGDLRIYEHTTAREFVGNTVLTDRGKITAAKIIVATHFPILNKHGLYFLKMYQQRSYVLALENAENVEGMYLGIDGDGLSLRNHGNQLLIGGGGHRTGRQGLGWAAAEAFAKRYYPASRETCRWATQDCMTLDGIPYIGRYSKHTPNLFVATGFNKWGMTSSMAAAMLLRDLVQDRQNPYEAVFSPSRSMMHSQLLYNAAEAGLNLLTPTMPRCPHMGCALKWNPKERSWDCPCHGSRFTQTGKLMDNPATGDLKHREKGQA